MSKRKKSTVSTGVRLFCDRSVQIAGKRMGTPDIVKLMGMSSTTVNRMLTFLFFQFGPSLIEREEAHDGSRSRARRLLRWELKRKVEPKDFMGMPSESTLYAKWRRKKEAEAEKMLKQAYGGFTIKDDPLVDPPGPLFATELKPGSVIPGKGMMFNPETTPFLQIMKAIKQSEAAILCHMDKMDERELKRFRILEEMLAHIASTAERWAEIESRLGKLALSAGRIPALESKVAILTEEIRKARREVGFMNPKLDKLCKEWGVKP